MTGNQSRLERRVQRDFPDPGAAQSVLQLLAELPQRAGYDRDVLASERIQAAIVLVAGGNIGRLRREIDLAMADWRDVLVAAGLAGEDWPRRLDSELGPDIATTVLWRPIGPEELELVREAGWQAWPPRLPGQPIFYPVLNE